MAPPAKSLDRRKRPPPKEKDEISSLNLWVGDLAANTTDADLMDKFRDYGAMDALTSYTPRTYAFVFFRSVEDAKKAKDELQGKVVKGSRIKIQFARSAKPGRGLWIGGISSSITEEQLKDELLQFGKLEEYKFLRDRNSALVGYCSLEDAIAAQKNIDGKNIGGDIVRADFQKPQYEKPQSSKRDFPENHNSRGSRRSTEDDDTRGYLDSPNRGSKRHLPQGEKPDGQPSRTLWVGYPSSVHIDEQMLHNAMILFGEIESIKSFASRNYSFVEFRSFDEARRAKEGLEGRLFGDPRIKIMFANSDLAHGSKDGSQQRPAYRVPVSDNLLMEAPFGSMEIHGLKHIGAHALPGRFLPNESGPSTLLRSRAIRGFDPHPVDSDFPDLSDLADAPNWRKSSPTPGLHSSSIGMRPPLRPMTNEWNDGFGLRESKRSRIDGSHITDASIHGRRVGGEGIGNMSGLLYHERDFPSHSHLSAVVRGSGRLHGSPDINHCWRGVIAKGDLPVCHARCVPIGKGLESPLPEIVNCFARTDLDRLARHYEEAIGFDVVFFLPDSEDDFDSYTEFLHYLGLRDRVGVARCDDGTTLFLVPPSDFLSNVLKISGPRRLYGVVLKLPQQSTTEVSQPPATPPPSRYSEQRQEPAARDGYDYIPSNEVPAFRMDYGSRLNDNSISQSGTRHTNQAYDMPSASDYQRNPDTTSQAGVSLTPELIATLTSLVPSSRHPSTAESSNMPISSSLTSSSFPSNVANAPRVPAAAQIQECPPTLSSSQLERRVFSQQQQFGGQYGAQAPFTSQYPEYANLPNVPDNSVQSVLGGADNSVQSVLGGALAQDLTSNMPQISATHTRHLDNYALSQGQSLLLSNQQYRHDSSFDLYNSRGMHRGTDAMGLVNQPVQQQSAPTNSFTHVQTANVVQNQIGLNANFSAQMQQLQMNLQNSGDGTSQGDADKNERYQSTLKFAASLLQKIQQHQQGSSPSVGGPGKQQ